MGFHYSALSYVLRLADVKPTAGRQKYCRACGNLIQFEAAYCPNCGASQEAQVVTPRVITQRGVTETVVKKGRRIRLSLFFLSLAIFIVAFLLGSTASLTRLEADAIVREFQGTIGQNPTATMIFTNNIFLCLLFFIPVAGTAFLAFVGYSTGTVLAAVAISTPNSPSAISLALLTLILPWTWMEFAAYSLASTEGPMIIAALIRRTLRRELRVLLISMAVSTALLALGAIVEAGAIRSILGG